MSDDGLLEALAGQWALVAGNGELILASPSHGSLLFYSDLFDIDADLGLGYIRAGSCAPKLPQTPLDAAAGWWIAYSEAFGLLAIADTFQELQTQVVMVGFLPYDLVAGYVRPS